MAVANHEVAKAGRLKSFFEAPRQFVEKFQSGDRQLRELIVVIATLGSISQDELELLENYGGEMRDTIIHLPDLDAGRLIKALFTTISEECANLLVRETFVNVFNHLKTKADLLALTDHQAGKRIKRIALDMDSLDMGTLIQRICQKCLEAVPSQH